MRQSDKMGMVISVNTGSAGRLNGLYGYLLCAALSLGAWGCVLSTFPLSYSPFIWGIVLAMPAAVYFILARFERISGIFMLLVFAIVCIFFHTLLWESLLLSFNAITSHINSLKGLSIVPYATAATSSDPALLFMVSITSFGISFGVKERFNLLAILCSAPLVLFSALYFTVSLSPFLVLAVVCWVGLSVPAAGAVLTKGAGASAALLSAIAILFFIALYSVYPLSAYKPIAGVDALGQKIAEGSEAMRYEKRSADIDTLEQGDLRKADGLQYTGETVMKLYMQTPRAVYLRGFIGGQYDGGKWTTLDDAAYGEKYLGLYEWLAQKGYYPAFQLQQLGELDVEATKSNVYIQNISASSKYVYTPYEAIRSKDLAALGVEAEQDKGLYGAGLTGTREYSFEMYLPFADDYGTKDFSLWLSLLEEQPGYEAYAEYETAYRAFVYDQYLSIPEEMSLALREAFTEEFIQDISGRDYKQVVRAIRKTYDENMKFSYDKVDVKQGEDPLVTFLEAKEGYDMHFASAAVLLLREAGIPARYAEGYFVSKDEIGGYADRQDITFSIPDYFGHAWAEIYVEGMGWIPVEVTPGYYIMSEESSEQTALEDEITQIKTYLYTDEEELPDGAESSQEAEEEGGSRQWWVYIILAVIVLVLIYLIAGRVYVYRRKRSFSTGDAAKDIRAMYAYLKKLLVFDGVHIKDGSEYESILPQAERYGGAEMHAFLDACYRARYSAQIPNNEETEGLRTYLGKTAGNIYASQSFGKKLVMRLIRFLY